MPFIRTKQALPDVATARAQALKNILVDDGSLARWISELMFVAISEDRRCMYCGCGAERA